MTPRSATLARVALLVAVAFPAVASAQNRAIVTTSDGSRDDAQARRAVVGSLEGVVEVVSRDDVSHAAQAAHESAATQAGVLAAARTLRADFVVTVSVQGRGARARTTLVVTAADGRELGRTEVGPPFGRIGAQNVGNAAITLVQEAQNALTRRRAGQENERPFPRQDYAQLPPPETRVGRAVGAAPWVRAVVGVDVRMHDASVELATGGTRAYSSGATPELGAMLELHPLVGTGEAGAGAYVRVDTAVAVAIDTQDDPSQPHYGTHAWRFAGALGYLGTVADGVLGLGASLGLGADAFVIDPNNIYPSTLHGYLRFGLDLRVALARDLLTLAVGGGYRVVLGTGDLDAAFGVSEAHGWDLGVALGGTLDVGFTYALRFAYERYDQTFDGSAGLLGTGARGSDQSVRVGLFLGWSFY